MINFRNKFLYFLVFLFDDPKPYRKDVKILQANLYSFIKTFLNDDIEIDIPYEKSERLRLKNIN